MKYDISDLELTADYLKEKQSVRATFRLPVQVIKIISLASTQLGIKQKTLIDQLVEDRETLMQVAREAQNVETAAEDRKQKTFVLSRKSLVSLEKVSDEYHLPRDFLVEISINRLLPVIDAEQKKLEKRKVILADMEQYQQEGIQLLKKTAHVLGNEDQVTVQLKELLEQAMRNIDQTRKLIERGMGKDNL